MQSRSDGSISRNRCFGVGKVVFGWELRVVFLWQVKIILVHENKWSYKAGDRGLTAGTTVYLLDSFIFHDTGF